MFGGNELETTVFVILLVELAFVGWLFRAPARDSRRLVDDAVRLGLRSRRRRA